VSSYRISDVPKPTGISRWAVSPVFPLFAFMFGGALSSWVWFCVNSVAMNSPTRNGDIAIAASGVLVSTVLVSGLLLADTNGIVSATAMPYALLLVTCWKLVVSYVLFIRQIRPYGVFEYYNETSPHGPQLVLFTLAVRFLQPFPAIIGLVLF
jgi:hypothetical protein